MLASRASLFRSSAPLCDWGGTGGIRAFKFQGPKPSPTRKKNKRERNKIITANLNVLRSLREAAAPPPRRVAAPASKVVRPKVTKPSSAAAAASSSGWKDVPDQWVAKKV